MLSYPSAVVHFQVTAGMSMVREMMAALFATTSCTAEVMPGQPLHVHLLRLFQRPEAVAVQPVLPVYQAVEHPCASDGGGHLLDIVQKAVWSLFTDSV